MRHYIALSFITLLLGQFVSAQVVTYYPQLDDLEREITIVVNLNLAKGPQVADMLGTKEDIYLWAGASDDAANVFQWTPTDQINFKASYLPGRMTSMGNNRWKITLTPRTYFNLPEGKKIELIGLLLKNASGSAQTEDLMLRAVVETAIGEVVIKSRKPVIEQMADRTVLNVSADVNAAGSTLFEVLQKAPGLAITGDEQLQMNGKSGLNVFIDGRPSQLSGRDLTNYLQSLPAGSVEKVEIYSNPPARFDAQGNAGIINIRLRKGLGDGWNGSAFGSYTQQLHYRSQAGATLNVRHRAINYFGQWSGQSNYQHTQGYVNRQVGDRLFANRTTDEDRSPLQQNWRAGMDWQINKQHTLGLLVGGRDNRTDLRTPGTTRISEGGSTMEVLQTLNESRFRQGFLNPNLNYRYQDNDRFTLNVDADWTQFTNRINNTVESRFFDEDEAFLMGDNIKNNLHTDINVASLRTDATWNLESVKARFEAGQKSALSRTTNDLAAWRGASWAEVSPDTNRTNTFLYQEDIHAAYVNFYQRPNDQWEWQAGLRGEYTDAQGTSTDLTGQRLERPDTSYFNVFPSAFVQYRPADKHAVKLAYTRRISRPSYQDLNPFLQILDAYTGEVGNPYLRPAFTHNLELMYSYRDAASVSFGVNQTADPLQWMVIQQGERAFATTNNIGTQRNAYLNLNVPLPIKDWWFMYAYFGVYYNHYDANLPDGAFRGGRLGANLYMNHSLTLRKGWSAQAEGWWNAPTRELIYRNRGLGSINFGVKKQILDNKVSIRLTINDVLNTQRWQQSADFGAQDFTLYRKWESRGVRLSVDCRLGNQNIKTARERSGGAESEQGRIKAGTGGRN
jgi:iron complex outermembrane recepter protein